MPNEEYLSGVEEYYSEYMCTKKYHDAVACNSYETKLNGTHIKRERISYSDFIAGRTTSRYSDVTTTLPTTHQKRGSLQLWQFLVAMLDDPCSTPIISWTGRGLEFKLIEPEEVARRWGVQKNRPAMNYDKLSRSLRYYYEKGIMQKVAGERYVYKFVCDPEALFSASFLANTSNDVANGGGGGVCSACNVITDGNQQRQPITDKIVTSSKPSPVKLDCRQPGGNSCYERNGELDGNSRQLDDGSGGPSMVEYCGATTRRGGVPRSGLTTFPATRQDPANLTVYQHRHHLQHDQLDHRQQRTTCLLQPLDSSTNPTTAGSSNDHLSNDISQNRFHDLSRRSNASSSPTTGDYRSSMTAARGAGPHDSEARSSREREELYASYQGVESMEELLPTSYHQPPPQAHGHHHRNSAQIRPDSTYKINSSGEHGGIHMTSAHFNNPYSTLMAEMFCSADHNVASNCVY